MESELNDEQRALLETKRQEALKKRKFKEEQAVRAERWRRKNDTHGGFFVEEENGEKGDADAQRAPSPYMEPPPDLLNDPHKKCEDCGQEFYDSLLMKQFGVCVCDNCRRANEDGKYSLITKTEARQEYLLNETDLDVNYDGLRCIEKKNPQNERWGMMKLYLRSQVEKICFERYGGEEGLDAEIVRRSKEKLKSKEKRQKNKIAQLRKETYTSLWRKPTEAHEHEFGGEEEREDGAWVKRCTACGFEVEFEKM